MKNNILYILLFIVSLSNNSYSQENNLELQAMADADQASRNVSNIDWTKLNHEDSLRRERVMFFIKEGKINTAKDHFNAGIIFQHGNDTIASALAVKSFKTALELDDSQNRWWYPASVDRDLMRRGLPQIYGTQFIKNNSTNNKWQRYLIDTSVISDEKRKYYGIETLAEQETKERLMNQQNISEIYSKSNSIDKTIIEIKKQFYEGTLSSYNVSEDAVNNFGYELLNNNKTNEAVEIFKLNTELYPNAYNTFDSYGEILLKIGRKKDAKKAYKKSLELNNKNENAKQILKSL